MNIFEILSIIFMHFLADFYLQTDEQAVNKSKSIKYLLSHTFIYSVFMCLTMMLMLDPLKALLFGLITFILHTLTDFITSRVNKYLLPKEVSYSLKLYKEKENINFTHFPEGRNYHNFFLGIGFDQMLHYFQLFLTFYFLK